MKTIRCYKEASIFSSLFRGRRGISANHPQSRCRKHMRSCEPAQSLMPRPWRPWVWSFEFCEGCAQRQLSPLSDVLSSFEELLESVSTLHRVNRLGTAPVPDVPVYGQGSSKMELCVALWWNVLSYVTELENARKYQVLLL